MKTKKIIMIITVLLLISILTGCGGKANQDGMSDNIDDAEEVWQHTGVTTGKEYYANTGDTEMPDTQSEALSVNEVQDDDTYYTMEDIKALDIPEDMLAYWMVLNSKMPFVSYNEGKQEFYWDEYHWILGEPVHFLGIPEKNIYWGDPRSFTIVDMNNDGKNEMVIYLEFGIAQILYYEDGVVYGYQFTERGMSPIYSNGIYEGFISAEHCDYHRLTELNKDGFTEEKIAEAIYSSSGDNYYEIGGISVSQEEFEEFKQSLADAGEAECIDYTEDLLDEHLLGGLSEEEWRMIKHVAVVPMTDMMEYVMETEMMQAYYEVLTGEKEFISVMDDNQLFNIVSYQDRNENDRGEDEILYFSIVDIDRNGTYEVILTDSETNILYYKDGDVYCYRYNFYEIGALSNSGIFSIDNLYYERIDGKFGIINSINEDGCDIEEVDYNGNINDDRIRYYYFSEEMIEQYFR